MNEMREETFDHMGDLDLQLAYYDSTSWPERCAIENELGRRRKSYMFALLTKEERK